MSVMSETLSSNDVRTYRTASWARPPRAAVFFDANLPAWEPSWRHRVLRIIGAVSEVWGGFHFILIPYRGRGVAAPWDRILRTYDPDLVVEYATTGADWAAA